jgi:excinuclease ABC subunit A
MVFFVEHKLELVKITDWVIDLGSEGGLTGGELVAEGASEKVAKPPGSITGQYLDELLK